MKLSSAKEGISTATKAPATKRVADWSKFVASGGANGSASIFGARSAHSLLWPSRFSITALLVLTTL
jgi:hypothetical protein